MKKSFNFIIIVFSYILSFLSLIAFVFIHIELSDREFQLDLEGIKNYFRALTEFRDLFAGTITLIVAYYGIQRFEAAESANIDRIKLDRYVDWKNITESRMNEIKTNNLHFSKEFSRIRFNFYNDLYENKMAINDRIQLEKIYDKYFKKRTPYFEETTNKYISLGGIYPNKDFTYFFDDFYIVFIDCLDSSYDDIFEDTKSLYVANLNPNRTINETLYNEALEIFKTII